MSDPIQVALDAYDAALNEQLGSGPGSVLGDCGRRALRDNVAIRAMLAAHETAVRGRAFGDFVDEMLASVEDHPPAECPCCRAAIAAIAASAKLSDQIGQ